MGPRSTLHATLSHLLVCTAGLLTTADGRLEFGGRVIMPKQIEYENIPNDLFIWMLHTYKLKFDKDNLIFATTMLF